MRKIIPLLCCVLLLVGCSHTNAPATLRLSEVTHSVFYAPQYAAMALGYFEEEGIRLELTNAGGSDKAMTAVLSGQADMGLMGPETAVFVANEGKEDHPVIIGQLTKRDGSFLIGRTPQEDFQWSDLAGKTVIGGRKGGMPQMTLEYVMKQHGIVPGVDAVVETNVQFDLMAGAFLGGDADYVTLFEPSASLFEKEQGGYIVSAVGAATEDVPYTAYIVTPQWLKNNKDLAKRFLRALHRGQDYVLTQDAEAIAKTLLDSFPDTELGLLTQVVKRYQETDCWTSQLAMEKDAYERLLTIMEDAGELQGRPDYDALVDNRLAREVEP